MYHGNYTRKKNVPVGRGFLQSSLESVVSSERLSMTASDRCKQRRNFDIYTGGNGMERFTLAQAAEWTKGETAGDAVLTAVSTDSRRIPQEALFLPLAGERFDGHDFIGKALENGAAAVMSHRACEDIRSRRSTSGTPRRRCSIWRAATA